MRTAASGRKLNLRLEVDRSAIVEVLTEQGINLKSDVVQFASSSLSDDWLIAWASSQFNVRTTKSGTSAIGLAVWAELVKSIFEMRAVPRIHEQIRRLCTPSHEALDTCLVLQVAGGYARQGFSISFEPNGHGCNDLLIDNGSFRSYIEVKRENEQDHQRHLSVLRLSGEILGRLEPRIRTWLEDSDLRLEVKFSTLITSGTVIAITDEIDREVRVCEEGRERVLKTVPDARYVLLKRLCPPYYEKGIRSGTILVKQAGTPAEVVPQNMPVLVVFNWLPNLAALKWRIQKASRQLKNDTAADREAQGFFVMQVSHGEAAKEAVISRYFSSLPVNCLGIVLLSSLGFVIPRSGLSTEITDIMALAATPRISRR